MYFAINTGRRKEESCSYANACELPTRIPPVFDAEKGRFVIDQVDVDVHTAELKMQLDNA